MRSSRRFVTVVVAVSCLVCAVPAALAGAEEPQLEAPAPGATGATGQQGAAPGATGATGATGEAAEPSVAEEEPEERTGVVVQLTVSVEVEEDETKRTKSVDWKADEPGSAPALAAIREVTGIRIRTETGAEVAGDPTEAVDRLVRSGKLSPGDRVGFTGGDGEAVSVGRKIPGGGRRVLSVAGGLAALLLFALVVLRGWTDVKKLVIGEDKRYSSSKFQIVLWFAVLIALYLSAVWLRSWASFGSQIAGIGIPTNLLLLSGLSVLSFAGAKGIKQSQIANAQARHVKASQEAARMQATATQVSAAAQGGNVSAIRRAAVLGAQAGVVQGEADRMKKVVEKITKTGKPSFPLDLVRDNDEKPDLGSFQMLVVTLLAVGTYLWIALAWQGGAELVKATGVTLPDVDTTILAAFGLGQGAYLTKKFAENPS